MCLRGFRILGGRWPVVSLGVRTSMGWIPGLGLPAVFLVDAVSDTDEDDQDHQDQDDNDANIQLQ